MIALAGDRFPVSGPALLFEAGAKNGVGTVLMIGDRYTSGPKPLPLFAAKNGLVVTALMSDLLLTFLFQAEAETGPESSVFQTGGMQIMSTPESLFQAEPRRPAGEVRLSTGAM
jgi:hypothetical protein